MKKIFVTYNGLCKEVWIFALMTVINRIGAMVVPFLSKYLYDDLSFSYAQIGTVMLFFGLGSFLGTFIVGKISRYFCSYLLMVFSMLGTGVFLFTMQFIESFLPFCMIVFFYSLIADMFRPVMIATLKDYVDNNDRVRALSLIRIASNFGFIVSPIIAGLVIVSFGYVLLFVIDSISSIIAIVVFVLFVKEKKVLHKLVFKNFKEERFPFLKDKLLLIHCFVTVLTGYIFFQIFSILPLYYNVYLKLDTSYNSIFLVFYGLVLFLFEIPIVEYVKRKNFYSINSIMYGIVLIGLGYFCLVSFPHLYTVFVALIFIAMGSMLTFSFATDFVLERAYKRQEGKFLSYFQISYSIAHVLSAKIGLYLVEHFGYTFNFIVNIVIAVLGVIVTYYLMQSIDKERDKKKYDIAKSFFVKQ
jgi:predicted MFS family arabinose efflux permease